MKQESTASLYHMLSLVFVGLAVFVCMCTLLLLLRVVQPPGPLAPRGSPTNLPLAVMPTDTNTAIPSNTPTPSRTPSPTRTPIPSPTPLPSATPTPPATATPTPQPTLDSGAPTVRPTGTPVQMFRLLVAQKNLPFGASISAADVTFCEWPTNLVPLNAYDASGDASERVRQIVGFVTRIDIPGGFPLLSTALLEPGLASRVGLPSKPVPAGPGVACPKDFSKTAQVATVVQQMPRGFKIIESAVKLSPFPAEIVPKNALTDLKQVVGKTVCIDLPREVALLTQHIGTVPPANGTVSPNMFNFCTKR